MSEAFTIYVHAALNHRICSFALLACDNVGALQEEVLQLPPHCRMRSDLIRQLRICAPLSSWGLIACAHLASSIFVPNRIANSNILLSASASHPSAFVLCLRAHRLLERYPEKTSEVVAIVNHGEKKRREAAAAAAARTAGVDGSMDETSAQEKPASRAL